MDIPTKPQLVLVLKGIDNIWESQKAKQVISDLEDMGYRSYRGVPFDKCRRSIAQIFRYHIKEERRKRKAHKSTY